MIPKWFEDTWKVNPEEFKVPVKVVEEKIEVDE